MKFIVWNWASTSPVFFTNGGGIIKSHSLEAILSKPTSYHLWLSSKWILHLFQLVLKVLAHVDPILLLLTQKTSIDLCNWLFVCFLVLPCLNFISRVEGLQKYDCKAVCFCRSGTGSVVSSPVQGCCSPCCHIYHSASRYYSCPAA